MQIKSETFTFVVIICHCPYEADYAVEYERDR